MRQVTPAAKVAIIGDVFEAKDLSAFALITPELGAIVSDEGSRFQMVAITENFRSLAIKSTHDLPGGGESDLEGAAFGGGFLYLCGSHGLSSKSGKLEEERFRLFRIPVGKDGKPGAAQTASLAALIAGDPALRPHFHKQLQHGGTNIEGLAYQNGRLFAGFRSPLVGGKALVLEFDANALFTGGDPTPKRHEFVLPEGAGMGIRDLAAVAGGFLIAAGNSGAEPSDDIPTAENYADGRGFRLYHWKPGDAQARDLGEIPDPAGKAETIVPINAESAAAPWDILLIYDGPKGGAPIRLRVE
ncbi:MAG: DUF3616 domain-containing protein [Verrucomicrobiales bacterium]